MEGRFISKDPIGFKGGDMVLYGYTKNNPISNNDPNGLTSVGGSFGATLGVVTLSTAINSQECCDSNGNKHVRTVRTWCLGYELGLSIKAHGANATAGNSKLQSCPSTTEYSYENGPSVWGAIIGGTSYSFNDDTNSLVTGLGGGYRIYENCKEAVIFDTVSGECCNK